MSAKGEQYGVRCWLHERLGTGGDAFYALIAAGVAVAVSGFAAHEFKEPLLFPSLGPVVFLLFETPLAATASPRNTLIGHAVGLAVGYGSLVLFGLRHAPSVLEAGVTTSRIGAASASVAVTVAVLILLRASHPPAGATTLIVSLGILATPHKVLMMAIGVVLLTVVGWVLNRLLGVPVPVWSSSSSS
jgi:CBS-domain-containing membrane protein